MFKSPRQQIHLKNLLKAVPNVNHAKLIGSIQKDGGNRNQRPSRENETCVSTVQQNTAKMHIINQSSVQTEFSHVNASKTLLPINAKYEN